MKLSKKTLTPFGARVKKALVDRRMSQREFCSLHNIPYNRLTDMLYGYRPCTRYRERVKKVLGIEESA